MIERVLLIFWAFWLLLILIAAFRVFAFPFARRRQDKRWGDGSRNQQSAVVIVPVKGFDPQASPRFFDTLFAQSYTNYRVIVAFESWHDPVAIWLTEELESSDLNPVWTYPDPESGLKSITLVCAGTSEREGQKVHNQRSAFRHLTPEDAVIAFIDADIVFKDNWLACLLAPINQKTHPLSTTYRWLIPKRPTLPNQIASVINGSITTQGGWESTTVLWGGSMAITRSVFDKLDVPRLLEGSLNDDLRISKAARAAGNRIAFVRSLIVPTMIDFNWSTFFEFAKRQYTQVKFFSPILYTGTNVLLGFYALGALSIIAALIYGYFFAWITVAAAYVIDQFRSLARQQIYLSLFPEHGTQRKLFSASWLEHMLTPVWMLLHWFILISTWTQTRITWAGITYRILAKDKTRILKRPVTAERLPVGVPGLAIIAALNDRKRGHYTQPIRSIATEPIKPVVEAPVVETPVLTAAPKEVLPAAAALEATPLPTVFHPGVSAFVTPLTALALPPARRNQPSPEPRTYLAGSPASGRRRPAPKPERGTMHLHSTAFYPTNPTLTRSTPPGIPAPDQDVLDAPAPESLVLSPEPSSSSPPSEESAAPALPCTSVAAHRQTHPRCLRMGVVASRTARSTRVNTPGATFPNGRILRPVHRGAAGRPG